MSSALPGILEQLNFGTVTTTSQLRPDTNSRPPAKIIFENLDDGVSINEIVAQHPVSRKEIKAVLDFAAHPLNTNDHTAHSS